MHGPFSWWNDRTWPVDGPSFTALPRAVMAIGKLTYDEDWQGSEPIIASYDRILQPFDKVQEKTKIAVSRLLNRSSGNERRGHDWVGPSELGKYNDLLVGAKGRFDTAKERVRELCAYGKLRSSSRAIKGGNFYEIPSEVWNTEDCERFFRCCQIEERDLPGGIGGTSRWLFIATDDLAAVCTRKPAEKIGAPMPSEADGYLSPYMLLALRCIRENGLTKENQVVKSSLESWLEAHWKEYGLPESQIMREYIASIIREPTSQKGRGR